MGCVLGKRVTGVGRESPPPSSTAVNGGGKTSREEDKGSGKMGCNRRFPRLPERRRDSVPANSLSAAVNCEGWPNWLAAVAGDALLGWTPRRADSFQKLEKIGQGTYSNVYKARDLETRKMVALKKVRFDSLEPESVKFMAREITLLRRLDHPNVVRLEGLVISRVSSSLYLVFEYMEHDLAGLVASPSIDFSEPQVKCYMKQLLSGLEHCHSRGVLHRDVKGSNLLLDNKGVLKIADFGLASSYDPDHRKPMTSRVVTLWYRPPELLLGATYYGVGVDVWSAGCILAELLAGKPILPGRTEVEQLHKIFKLCGSPSEEYWKKSKLPHATIFKPQQPYKRRIAETFSSFPPSAISLLETLLSIDPARRGTATAALNSEFFSTEPHACEPLSLPHYPPSKEIDAKLRDEEARRKKGVSRKGNGEALKKTRVHDRGSRAVPVPEANAELQLNLDRRRLVTRGNATSKSEKFPPPHQDGAVGVPLENSIHDGPTSFAAANDSSFTSSIFDAGKSPDAELPGHPRNSSTTSTKKKTQKVNPQVAPSQTSIKRLKPFSVEFLMDLKNTNIHKTVKGKELEVFNGGKCRWDEA